MMAVDGEEAVPAGFAAAMALVRALAASPDAHAVPGGVLAWAMMVEAVDRLVAAHGPAAVAQLLSRLGSAVLDGADAGATH